MKISRKFDPLSKWEILKKNREQCLSHYCDWMPWGRHPVSAIYNTAIAVTYRPTELSTYYTQCVPGAVDVRGNQYVSIDDHSARSTIEIRSAPSLTSTWIDDVLQTSHDSLAIFRHNTTLSPRFTYLIKHVTTSIITNNGHSHSLLQTLRLQIHLYNVQISVLTSKKTHCFSTSTKNLYKFLSFYTSRIVYIIAFGVVTPCRCGWIHTFGGTCCPHLVSWRLSPSWHWRQDAPKCCWPPTGMETHRHRDA